MARQTAEEILEAYIKELESVKPLNDINIKLPKGQTSYEYVIISDLNLGAKNNKPAIKKLIKQINFVKENKQSFVVLGGNLLAFTRDSREYKKYIGVMSALLEPIKDKIVLAYGSYEDKRFEKAKEPLYPNVSIISKLKLNPSKIVRSDGAVINITLSSKNTNDKTIVIKDRFISIKSTAQTFSAEGSNAFKNVGGLGNYDNIFVTCANNSGVFRKAIMRKSSLNNNDQIEKHSFNLVLDSGYKLLMKTPSNKIMRYNFTDKYSYKITPCVNKDASRVVGKNTLTEEPYKSFISRCVIGGGKVKNKIKTLTNAYLIQKKANEIKAQWLIDEIKAKLEQVNNINLNNLIKEKNKADKQDLKECEK